MSSSSQIPVFDYDHLRRYTDGDAALEAELAGLLFEQAERCIAIMKAADDTDTWSSAVHTLKGAARGVGAVALSMACEAVETAQNADRPEAIRSIEQARDTTRRVIDETLKT